MSLLNSLFGPRAAPDGDEKADQQDQALIRLDIGQLDKVRAGLGEQLVDYIWHGKNDSALLTLASVKQEASEVIRPRIGWSSGGNWVTGRSDFLLASRLWRPQAVRRYGDVLAPFYVGGTWPKLPGTERSPAWLRTVLMLYGDSREIFTRHVDWKVAPPERAKVPWTIDKLESLLDGDDAPILDLAFERDDGWFSRESADRGSPEQMPGFEDHLRADPARRTSEMRGLSAKARSYGLRTLARLNLTDGAFFDFAFEQAGDAAKSAREAAGIFLRTASPAAVVRRTREAWVKMKPAQKIEIARVVAASCGVDAPVLLRDLLQTEKNESVLAELNRHLGQERRAGPAESGREDGPDGYTALDGEWVAAPKRAALPEDRPVSPAVRALISRGYVIWRDDATRHNREKAGEKYFHPQPVPPADASGIADVACAVLEGRSLPKTANRSWVGGIFWPWMTSKERQAVTAQILAHPDLTLWHLARHEGIGRSNGDRDTRLSSIFHDTPFSKAMRARLGDEQDLRAYEDLICALGSERGAMVRHILRETYWRPDWDAWPPDSAWPLFAASFALIDEALGLVAPSAKDTLIEANAMDALALFPKTPARYFSALLDRAIGDRKLVRQPARDLLAGAPNLDQLLIPLLKHPKSETRAGAAVWLGDCKATQAVDALVTAARAEKLPGPKAALLGAISRLGGDISEFVSAGALLGEAEEGLKKSSSKGLEWFPFDAMPALRQAGGDHLDPKVLRWWIVLAVKLKQPGGSPWFDLLLDELEPASAAKVGLAVMSAWITYDTAAPSEAEANAHAARHVDATLAQYRRWQPETTREQIFSMLRQTKLRQYFNSGNDQKGLLALAARAPGPEAVGIVRAYFRDHYMRTAQCKALLECLAANPSPVATQYVLAISKRWRTRTIQELAGELVAGIADRRGWTADQLADRTIPTGGFDDDGVLELPIGEKAYTSRLDAAGAIGLFNPDGKPVQSLPASATAEAAESLKASKAALSSARKEIKQVIEFQSHRLYEALCVERTWPAADWSEYLLRHPLVSRLVQRLIWLGFDEAGNRVAAFRPMEDLTLTDSADTSVDLDGVASVRLAHGTTLSAAEQAAWRAHLQDYEVKPLFDQIGREQLSADDLDKDATEIIDRKGWMIEAFKLRGAATKLGYTRGQAEDGGWFFTYQKSFDTLRLAAVVEFTGNGLPEENRTSALIALRFARMKKGVLRWNDGVPLSSVPPVLLSEAWNDFHQMAAMGTGFDADWEKMAVW